MPIRSLCKIDENHNLIEVLKTGIYQYKEVTASKCIDGTNNTAIIGYITDLSAESDKVLYIIDSETLIRRITLT